MVPFGVLRGSGEVSGQQRGGLHAPFPSSKAYLRRGEVIEHVDGTGTSSDVSCREVLLSAEGREREGHRTEVLHHAETCVLGSRMQHRVALEVRGEEQVASVAHEQLEEGHGADVGGHVEHAHAARLARLHGTARLQQEAHLREVCGRHRCQQRRLCMGGERGRGGGLLARTTKLGDTCERREFEFIYDPAEHRQSSVRRLQKKKKY